MTVNFKQLLFTHWLLPLVVLAVVSIVIVEGDIDRKLTDYIFAIQGGSWAWKDAWITEVFFHKSGRALSLLLALIVLLLVIASHLTRLSAAHKKPLLYLFLATSGSSLLISFLKSLLAVSCPWEFERYGGHLIDSGLVEQLFLRNGSGCFPAGHASAGYAWVSCYFFGLYYQSKWRRAGLIIPLLVGVVLGLVQQIRGAHFISHDVWSLALCWFFSLGLFCIFFKSHSEKFVAPELLCQ
jgi:membrane-associated PAP2 superfamily phosphatase